MNRVFKINNPNHIYHDEIDLKKKIKHIKKTCSIPLDFNLHFTYNNTNFEDIEIHDKNYKIWYPYKWVFELTTEHYKFMGILIESPNLSYNDIGIVPFPTKLLDFIKN